MTILNHEQRTELEQLLEQREQELQEGVQRLRESLATPRAGMDAEVLDRVEDGDARMMSSLDLTQLQREEEELRAVLEARQRMRAGTYGECQECGEPIPFARLQARPAARFCIVHEEAWEKANPGHAAATQ